MGHVSPAIVPRRAAPSVRYNPNRALPAHTTGPMGRTTHGSAVHSTTIEETESGIDLYGAIIVAEAIESIVLDDYIDSSTSFDTE